MGSTKRRSKPRDASERTGPAVPVVAIGGSAGSLQALEAFFHEMPADTGAAFVVLLHRDTQSPSFLPKVLEGLTSMRVRVADHGRRVEPNVVFVAPASARLGLEDGAFVLTELPSGPARPTSIDHFFRALADDAGERAVGIVLSGMERDGADGLRAIRERGGIAMVQLPESAPFASMPKSAIDAGPVDDVARPEVLAQRVASFLVKEPSRPVTELDAEMLREVIARLRDRQGHDFSAYKPSTLRRRIERRMHLRRVVRAADYLALLDRDAAEIPLLFDDLLIGVTRFFRDPDVFEVLGDRLLPEVLAAKPRDRPFRAWVAGCATGEEAYSIAIVVLECLERAGRSDEGAQIYATDLDKAAIEHARRGFYAASVAHDISPSRLSRFFVAETGGYRIGKAVRDLLVFAPQSLTADAPFTKLDLLSCRNVLIYLTSRVQERLVRLFFHALNPGGLLVVGSSETVSSNDDLFTRADASLKVFRRRETTKGGSTGLAFPLAVRPDLRPVPAAGPTSADSAVIVAARRLIIEEVAPLSLVVDAQGALLYASQRTGRYFEAATEHGTDVFSLAREGLEIHLRAVVRRALAGQKKVTKRGVRVSTSRGPDHVDIVAVPMHGLGAALPLVLLVLSESTGHTGAKVTSKKSTRGQAAELERARDQIRALVDERETSRRELRSANEELQTTNEELQSTNEELMTSKEEMESMNEELLMLNAELQSRNEQLAIANDDLRNVMNSSQIPTLFLDEHLRVRRFTVQATRIANVIATDVGRPITDITLNVRDVDLAAHVKKVLDELVFQEAEVRGVDGSVYMMRVHPYRTRENAIDGVVVTFLDITQLRRAALAATARERDEAIERMVTAWPGVAFVEETSSSRTMAVSAATVERLGYGRDTLAHAPRAFWRSIVHPDDRVSFDTVHSGMRGTVRLRRSGGQYESFVMTTAELVGPDEARGVLGCALHVFT